MRQRTMKQSLRSERQIRASLTRMASPWFAQNVHMPRSKATQCCSFVRLKGELVYDTTVRLTHAGRKKVGGEQAYNVQIVTVTKRA